MPQHHPKAASPGPARQPDLAECHMYLSAGWSKSSTTRRLTTILMLGMKELRRSCGWRAPRQDKRAGPGEATGGGALQVVQAKWTHPLSVEARTVFKLMGTSQDLHADDRKVSPNAAAAAGPVLSEWSRRPMYLFTAPDIC